MTTDQYAVMHESSVRGVEDMAALGDLHEGAILNNLKLRYFANEIYVGVRTKLGELPPVRSSDG